MHGQGAGRALGDGLARGAEIRPRGAAPAIGEHTAEVLTELGLSGSEQAALAAGGIIGGLIAPR